MTIEFVLSSPIGAIEVIYQELQICKINLDCQNPPTPPTNDFEKDLVEQLDAYFADPRHRFDLPLKVVGTKHQTAVWTEMSKITSGEVKTYGEIAALIGSSGQAVGNACRANPLPIIIPCHRVVAAHAIGGFAGATQGTLLDIKQRLLAHEGVAY
jgi:methylated-DNA-[protein]-cysteine S-methyltransferase